MKETGQSWQAYADKLPSLGAQWVDVCKRRGNPVVLADTLGTTLRSRTALTGSILLARQIGRLSPEQNIGLLLPSTAGSALANMACMLLGKTAVNLNFTASPETLLASMELAEIRTIYTSRRFLDKLCSRGVAVDVLAENCQLIMLEDLVAANSKLQRLLTLTACWLFPASVLKNLWCRSTPTDNTAAILFSSGSEGEPKGVMLSHRSISANIKQVACLLDFAEDDAILANLPPFHAFGLTVTYFLPLLERVRVVCHPDPTEAHGAAQAIAKHHITTMFGTSSFYRLYVRDPKVEPALLQGLRLVVAGAEKLQEQVRLEFMEKFNLDILEGYGATETAPVACVNIPDRLVPAGWKMPGSRRGSVGLPLPGTEIRIADPDTFTFLPTGESGMILIHGPQLMTGYFKNPQKSKAVLRELDGRYWYVSGDKGYLDEDGFLYIQDRYSRFAKIGGEMVGLGNVENALRKAISNPEFEVVVINLPDPKKGEKLVALCNMETDSSELREKLTTGGLNPLALPAAYFTVEAIPRLGSGKTDFASARQLAEHLSTTLQG